MTGVQALVRIPIEQAWRDADAGLRTGTMISGYPGSPIGGYDLLLERSKRYLEPLNIHHIPAVNEEIAAAIVYGAHMSEIYGGWNVDAITGIWYGKNPGLMRSIDVIKTSHMGGLPERSAVLAVVGDDPLGKSSAGPNYSEFDFYTCGIPVLYPGSPDEVLSLGLHGIAMSRFSGCWVGLKVVTNIADGGASVRVGPDRPTIVEPELPGYERFHTFRLGPPLAVTSEQALFEWRLPAAVAYGRANNLNAIVQRGPQDRIGLVAAGKTYTDLRQSLEDMGMGRAELERAGIRLLKVGMVYPLRRRAVPRVRRRPRAGRGRRGEARPAADGDRARALPAHEPARRRRQPWPGRAAHVPRLGRARRRRGDPAARAVPARARHRLRHQRAARRDRRDQGTRVRALRSAHPGLLLRLPAQPLHRAPGRRDRGRWQRAATGWRKSHRNRSGRRERARDGYRRDDVGRRQLLHRQRPHGPEHRRRHVLPLVPARRPAVRRGRHEHHLQAPLQPRRRDDGRPGVDRRPRDPPDRGADGRGGREEDQRRLRELRPLEVRRPARRHEAVRPRRLRGGLRGAARDEGRHDADLRPAVCGREAPGAQARPAADPREVRLHQRAGLRGLRRLRRRLELHVASSRSRPSSDARRRFTSRPATRTTRASRATALPS